MGADAADVPSPSTSTLSEPVGVADEAFEGTITDLYLPPKR
jgi:dihydrolipoamide dehydrogenase